MVNNSKNTVGLRFDEPLSKEVLRITNDILQRGLLKCVEQNFDIKNPSYIEPISLLPWQDSIVECFCQGTIILDVRKFPRIAIKEALNRSNKSSTETLCCLCFLCFKTCGISVASN